MFSTRGDVLLCGGEVYRLALTSGGAHSLYSFSRRAAEPQILPATGRMLRESGFQ
jgi:hypothetical protein